MTTAIQPASISSELGSAMGLAFWRNYHEEQRKKAEATGEARGLRKKAEDDAKGAREAGSILAAPRTPDDATKRLSDGTF